MPLLNSYRHGEEDHVFHISADGNVGDENGAPATRVFSFLAQGGSTGVSESTITPRYIAPQENAPLHVYARFRLVFDASGPSPTCSMRETGGKDKKAPGEAVATLCKEEGRRKISREEIHPGVNILQEEKKNILPSHRMVSTRTNPNLLPPPATTRTRTGAQVGDWQPPLACLMDHPVQLLARPDELVLPIRRPLSSVTISEFTREFLERLQYKHPQLASCATVSHYLVKQPEDRISLIDLPQKCPLDESVLKRHPPSVSRPPSSSLLSSSLVRTPLPVWHSSSSCATTREEKSGAHYWRIDAKMNQHDTLQDFFWSPSVTLPLLQRQRNDLYRANERDSSASPAAATAAASSPVVVPVFYPCPTYDVVVQWQLCTDSTCSEGLSRLNTNNILSSNSTTGLKTMASSSPAHLSSSSSSFPPSLQRPRSKMKKVKDGKEAKEDSITSSPLLAERLRLCEAREAEKAKQDLFLCSPQPVIHVTQRSTYLDLLSLRHSRREEGQEREYRNFLRRREKEINRSKRKEMKKQMKKQEQQRQQQLAEGKLIGKVGSKENERVDAPSNSEKGVGPQICAGISIGSLGDGSNEEVVGPLRQHHPSSSFSSFCSSSSSSFSSGSDSMIDFDNNASTKEEGDSVSGGGLITCQSEERYRARLQIQAEETKQRSRICEEEQSEFNGLLEREGEHCYHIYTLERLGGNTLHNGVWQHVIRENRRYPLDTQPIFIPQQLAAEEVWRRQQSNRSVCTTLAFRHMVDLKARAKHKKSKQDDDGDDDEEEQEGGGVMIMGRGKKNRLGGYGARSNGGKCYRDTMMDIIVEELGKREKEGGTPTRDRCNVLYPSSNVKDDQKEEEARRQELIALGWSPTNISSASGSNLFEKKSSLDPVALPPSSTFAPFSSSYRGESNGKKAALWTMEDLAETEAYQEVLNHYLDWRHEIISTERKDFREMTHLMKGVLAQQERVDRAAVALAYEEELKAALLLLDWDTTDPIADMFSIQGKEKKEEETDTGENAKEEENRMSFSTVEVKEEAAIEEEEEHDGDDRVTGSEEEEKAQGGDNLWSADGGEEEYEKDNQLSAVSGDESRRQAIKGGREKRVGEGGTRKGRKEDELESKEAFRKRCRDPRYRIVTEVIERLNAHAGERLDERLAKCREDFRRRKAEESKEKEV